MATPTYTHHYGEPIQLDVWDTFYDAMDDGELQVPTATSLVIKDSLNNRVVFHGDFIIDNGVVTGGTVTGFSILGDGTELMTATSFQISAVTLVQAIEWYQNGNSTPFWDLTFDVPLKQIGSSQDDHLYGNEGGGTMLGGSGNDHLWGGSGNETLNGGKGNDVISGYEGSDVLIGGAGKDVFLFGYEADIDRIKDFDVKADLIGLDLEDFEALGPGFVSKSEFGIGAFAKNVDQHLIYNKGTGALYYDQDGADAAPQVQIAQLSAGLDLKAGYFFLA